MRSLNQHKSHTKINSRCRASLSFIRDSSNGIMMSESTSEKSNCGPRATGFHFNEISDDIVEEQGHGILLENEDTVMSSQLESSFHSINQKRSRHPDFSREECEFLCSTTSFHLSQAQSRMLLDWVRNNHHKGSNITHTDPRTIQDALLGTFDEETLVVHDFHQDLDGPQYLEFASRNLCSVLKDLLANPEFCGQQYTRFHRHVDSNGRRVFGSLDTSDLYRILQERAGQGVSPVPVFMAIDGTVVLKGLHVRPIYGMSHSFNFLFHHLG